MKADPLLSNMLTYKRIKHLFSCFQKVHFVLFTLMCRTHECREGQGWPRATRNNLASHFGHGWSYAAEHRRPTGTWEGRATHGAVAEMCESGLERSLSNHSYGYGRTRMFQCAGQESECRGDQGWSRETREDQGEGEIGTIERLAWAMAESGLFRVIVQPALPACP